ncbi:hypothetical protein HPP92_007121 [Vanilla planifolia]|uniref:Uncharacterized protein n=1 Tax=Vanilla planifolia TaxID=51239 RepID=A0A835RGY4_VANPL|nr:hypothetical protein HPP92_007121 [Vanilla planifolia]
MDVFTSHGGGGAGGGGGGGFGVAMKEFGNRSAELKLKLISWWVKVDAEEADPLGRGGSAMGHG